MTILAAEKSALKREPATRDVLGGLHRQEQLLLTTLAHRVAGLAGVVQFWATEKTDG